MCTLAIFFQTSREFPLAIAANRDEFYDRSAAAPTIVQHSPWIVAGRDLVAGGTWLGLNEYGLVAGVLNRRTAARPDTERRSRGILCMSALQHSRVSAAAAAVQAEAASIYNPFNLLLASSSEAVVVGNHSGTMVTTPLAPGVHLLTNLDLNDTECPRIAKSFRLFEAAGRWLKPDSIDAFVSELRAILSDHSTPLDPRSEGPPNNLCAHTAHFGTRSSTVVLQGAGARGTRMWHADGAPCRVAYSEIDVPVSP